MIQVAIAGAAGRMGKILIEAVLENPQSMKLSVATVLAGDPALGIDAGLLAIGKPNGVTTQTELSCAEFDVLIDFTSPAASLSHLEFCEAAGKAIVIGTTGFSAQQLERISSAAKKIPVVFAPNYSIGVTLSFQLLKRATEILGNDYDVEISEAHHRHKKDAPSGTAIRMGEVIAHTRGEKLEDVAVYGRQGISEPRSKETIGFATVRAGDVVGDHTVTFAGNGERFEITHRASNRMTFASGAVRAAQWLANNPAGLYSMEDVLGF